MAVGKFYPGWQKQLFQAKGGRKNGEILFFLLETKKKTFFGKNVIGKCQISKSREWSRSPSTSPRSTSIVVYIVL